MFLKVEKHVEGQETQICGCSVPVPIPDTRTPSQPVGPPNACSPTRGGPAPPGSVERAVETARLVLRKMSPTAVLNLSQDSKHNVAGQRPCPSLSLFETLSLSPCVGLNKIHFSEGIPALRGLTDLQKEGGGCAETSCHATDSRTRPSWSQCRKERGDVGAKLKVCFQD